MTSQEKLMLAGLKGRIDGKVMVAKFMVQAACELNKRDGTDFTRGYRVANVRQHVRLLRELRDVQRHIHEYCKGVGYHD